MTLAGTVNHSVGMHIHTHIPQLSALTYNIPSQFLEVVSAKKATKLEPSVSAKFCNHLPFSLLGKFTLEGFSKPFGFTNIYFA